MKHTFLLLFLTLAMLAQRLAAAPSATFEDRIRAAELHGDAQQVAQICQEWYASGQFSSGALNWNYNALMSVEANALLFTENDLDTYPAFLLQNALGVRPDVRVLCRQLLENQGYRNQIAASRSLRAAAESSTLSDFLEKIIAAAPVAQPIYFGVMFDKNALPKDRASLFLTGLALKFSPRAFDNVAALRQNFEQNFRTDYLRLNLDRETDPQAVRQLNLNYIPAFALLHRHYLAAGDAEKAALVAQLSLEIGQLAGREAEVAGLFLPPSPAGAVVSKISLKSLEKAMKPIGGSLFAAETEVTNEQYELFLQDLLDNKAFDALQICRTTQTDWRKLLPAQFQLLPDAKIYPNGHPDDPNAPVQNISHEAAEQYCAWITKVYNAAPGKKKHQKVVFRLPTEQEWTQAAVAGRPQPAPYTWGTYSVQNGKGCYLGNLNATEPCPNCPLQNLDSNDGAFFTVRADAYYPNDFGLYCISGNVAEMLAAPGTALGGSWEDKPEDCQITSAKKYAAPSPAIGFRVFMEVLGN